MLQMIILFKCQECIKPLSTSLVLLVLNGRNLNEVDIMMHVQCSYRLKHVIVLSKICFSFQFVCKLMLLY